MTASNSSVRGLVGAGAHVRGGYGYAVEHEGPGVYTIRFLEPFDDAPVVLVTPGESMRAATANPSPAGVEVTITDMHGHPTDTDFAFIAEPV
jgi:hypothetical protein